MISIDFWRRGRVQEQASRAVRPVAARSVPARALGLVLGGGGGKGGAHLGVLSVLDEQRIRPDIVVGTSIGAVIGVLVVAGFSLHEIAELFPSNALRHIAALDPSGLGVFGNQRRRVILERMLGDRTFEDLPVPVAVVACDLVRGEEVLLTSGPLVPALLASTALPGIFQPVRIGERVLCDGGILNNVPVCAAVALGAQRTIAVELTGVAPNFSLPIGRGRLGLPRPPRQVAVAQRAFALLMAQATAARLAECPPDVLIQPDVGPLPTLNMANPHLGFVRGVTAAQAHAEQLLELRNWHTDGRCVEARGQPLVPAR